MSPWAVTLILLHVMLCRSGENMYYGGQMQAPDEAERLTNRQGDKRSTAQPSSTRR
jgi:hypothetical protein